MSSLYGPQLTQTVVEDIEINFDYGNNNERQYFLPGEVLTGTVVLHLRSPLQIVRLLTNVLGQAQVSWEIPNHRQNYRSSEVYIDNRASLLDETFERTVNFPRGSHEFPFQHQLPETCPSTFKGVYGSVSYVLKVELVTTNAQHNTITSQPFMVFRRPPLPVKSFVPKDIKKHKKYFNGCSFERLNLKAGLTRWGGVPGEYLYVNGEVTNFTDRVIKKVTSSLVLNSEYITKNKRIRFRQVISKREDEYTFETLHGRRWRAVKLQVPPYIPDTDLVGCSIMDVTYTFQFKVELEDHDLQVECPVLVGGHPQGYNALVDVGRLSRLARVSMIQEDSQMGEFDDIEHPE